MTATRFFTFGTSPALVDSLTGATGWRQFEPRQRSSRSIEDVEFATLEWVHWFTTARLHASHGRRAPAEVNADYYAETPRARALVTT